MRRRFFVERFEGDSATIRGDTAEHLGRVLRAEQGQIYELSDGHRVWLARIERVALSKRGEDRIEFALLEPIEAVAPSLHLSLLVSIVKYDRFEWCLEKATELGVDEIVPLAAARTDKPLVAAAGKRQERWNRILLESAQQSRRLRPPVLRPAESPAGAFANSTASAKIFLSERREVQPLREILRRDSPLVAQATLPALRHDGPVRPSSPAEAEATAAPTVSLAVGPEGGWTDAETAAARTNHFLEVSLGANVLRTETAVIASLAILKFTLGTD
ncbi:MAG: RsmE family RNA methyltransferase [Candidatus Acidiferrales bacterium]